MYIQCADQLPITLEEGRQETDLIKLNN